jgi:hypothetical protein
MIKNGKYDIIYLEDELSKDKRIQKLQEIAKQENCNFECYNSFDKMKQSISRFSEKYDIVICDIEIWKKKDGIDILTGLGFSYIDELLKTGYNKPVYIILTNISRNFHDNITRLIPGIRKIFQKDEVLNSEQSIKSFIKWLKIETTKNKKLLVEKNKTTKTQEIFNRYYNHIKETPALTITVGKMTKYCEKYQEIESLIQTHLTFLITSWKTKREKNPTVNICAYVSSKISMADEIKQLGSVGQYNKQNTEIITEKLINSFIVKLIVRRFIIYIHHEENIPLSNACWLVSGDKRFIDNCLLFSTSPSPLYSDEEKEYLKELKK